MDFEATYTPEQEAFRAEVRSWFAEHAPQTDGDREAPENYPLFRELGRKLGAKGWLRPTLPAQYGGGGLPIDQALVIHEEADRLGLPLPPYYDTGGILSALAILAWGTEEQKARWVPPIARGEVVTWQLFSGPRNGSDLAACDTDAIRDGDHYVLNGTKVFVGGTNAPDQHWVLGRTDPSGPRHHNLGAFMVPHDLPGITMSRMELLGHNTSDGKGEEIKNIVYFNEVRVPAENLIGGETQGWQVVGTTLEFEHGGAGSVGRNHWYERALKRATELERGGSPLLEHADAQALLADLYILTETQRLLGLRNFWMNQTKQEISYEGSQLSYYRKIANLRASHVIMDLLGPYALTSDERWDPTGGQFDSFMRGAIVALHPGGTADIQKVIMARRIGIGRSERERMARTAR